MDGEAELSEESLLEQQSRYSSSNRRKPRGDHS